MLLLGFTLAFLSIINIYRVGGIRRAQGVEQVNVAMTQMDAVTQRSASSAEETASAPEELNAQAVALNDAVQSLKVIIEGAKDQYL